MELPQTISADTVSSCIAGPPLDSEEGPTDFARSFSVLFSTNQRFQEIKTGVACLLTEGVGQLKIKVFLRSCHSQHMYKYNSRSTHYSRSHFPKVPSKVEHLPLVPNIRGRAGSALVLMAI